MIRAATYFEKLRVIILEASEKLSGEELNELSINTYGLSSELQFKKTGTFQSLPDNELQALHMIVNKYRKQFLETFEDDYEYTSDNLFAFMSHKLMIEVIKHGTITVWNAIDTQGRERGLIGELKP